MLCVMSENPAGTPNSLVPGQLPPVEGAFEDPELRTRWEVAGQLRAAQEAWLERRDVLGDTPYLTMTRREFKLLRDVGLGDSSDTASFLDEIRKNYGIPSGVQYASVDIVSDEVSLPQATELVAVSEEDFGTVIDVGRLERHDIEPGDMPHLTMTRREFGLFGIIGIDGGDTSSLIEHARGLCGIPQEDQYAPQYALIDIKSDDPTLPSQPLLVDMTEADFGTTIEPGSDNKYFQNTDPNNPLMPESGSAYITVDIEENGTLAKSWQELRVFATELMRGKTANPLSGSFWVRAGGVAADQKDAYVWEDGKPFTSSVKLTIDFPSQYDSVCVVVGDRRDPINGKAGMAQIKDPTVVLTVEGENLKRLQAIYRDLYRVPGFALTDTQRQQRDESFNSYLASLISEAARKNQAAVRRAQQPPPQLRTRQVPRS